MHNKKISLLDINYIVYILVSILCGTAPSKEDCLQKTNLVVPLGSAPVEEGSRIEQSSSWIHHSPNKGSHGSFGAGMSLDDCSVLKQVPKLLRPPSINDQP